MRIVTFYNKADADAYRIRRINGDIRGYDRIAEFVSFVEQRSSHAERVARIRDWPFRGSAVLYPATRRSSFTVAILSGCERFELLPDVLVASKTMR